MIKIFFINVNTERNKSMFTVLLKKKKKIKTKKTKEKRMFLKRNAIRKHVPDNLCIDITTYWCIKSV